MAASSAASSAEPAAAATGKLSASALAGDVGVAATGSTAEGFGYVGVWAKDAAACAAIGTATETDFAVITGSTFRDGPSASYGNFGPLADGKATLEAGGSAGSRSIAIEQTSPDALTIDGKAYIRCTP
jgi:hypothetical protein